MKIVVSGASGSFTRSLDSISFGPAAIPVYADETAAVYPTGEAAIRDQLGRQLANAVRFVEMIQAMYDSGARTFVEVGPGSQIIVVTDQTQVRVGDCVNVEQAGSGTANVRRVSEARCEAIFAGDPMDDELQAYMTQEADMCLQAKERLMEAETDEAFETAMRRVKFLCDY